MENSTFKKTIYHYKNSCLTLGWFAMFYEPRQEIYEFLCNTFNPEISSKIDAIYKGRQEYFMWGGVGDPEEIMGILSENVVIYVFFKIISAKRKRTVIKAIFTGSCKLWFNNKLIGAANGLFNETLIWELQEGENLIVFESTGFDDIKGMSFCIKNYEKEMELKYSSLLYKTYQFAKEEVRLVDDGDDPDKNRKQIYAFPRDIIHLDMDREITVQITDCIDNLPLDTFHCKFYDTFTIDGSKYSSRISYRKLNGIKITVFYYHKNKIQYSVSNYLITKNPQAQIKAVGDKAYEMIADGYVPTKSIPYKIIYSFDCPTTHTDYKYLFYPQINPNYYNGSTAGKLFRVNKPILCIIGTSSKQGKFTLQLEIRKQMGSRGYKIGQLSTEPSGSLFDMDECFHFGYNANYNMSNDEIILYVNQLVDNIAKKDCDIIISGCQSETLQHDTACLENFTFKQLAFLMGLQPDAVVLVINPYDEIEYIKRTILFINSFLEADVIGIVIYPMHYKNIYSGIYGGKIKLSQTDINILCEKLNTLFEIPTYGLDDVVGLIENIIDYFQ